MAGIDISKSFSTKLKVIAKHMNALADELQEIDDYGCPECGSRNIERVIVRGDKIPRSICTDCGCEFLNKEDIDNAERVQD